MKKKLILAGAAMLLTAAAVTGFSAYNKTDASDLLNANIEALTGGESEGGEICYNSITSAEGQQVRYCPECRYVSGAPSFFAKASKCN